MYSLPLKGMEKIVIFFFQSFSLRSLQWLRMKQNWSEKNVTCCSTTVKDSADFLKLISYQLRARTRCKNSSVYFRFYYSISNSYNDLLGQKSARKVMVTSCHMFCTCVLQSLHGFFCSIENVRMNRWCITYLVANKLRDIRFEQTHVKNKSNGTFHIDVEEDLHVIQIRALIRR
jgi:hypothetical protein